MVATKELLTKELWTVEKLRVRAEELGKPFNPNPEIVGRLESDLAKSDTLVFFTESEITAAVEDGRLPAGLKPNLLTLVNGRNDIAILPKEALDRWKEWQETQAKAAFLKQKNC